MKTRKVLCALIAALLLALSAVPALASVPSAPTEYYYLDQANVLSEDTEGEIFFSNQLLYDACGAQIVVVAVDSTKPQAIDDYTNDLFNKWSIGSAENNNGFLLVMAIDDEDYYALCGANLQPKFTSSAMKDYFDDYLEADFAAGRYDAGAKKFFEAVFRRIADTYDAEVTTAQGIAAYKAWVAEGEAAAPMVAQSGGGSYRGGYEEDDGGSGILMMLFLVLLVIMLIVVMSRASRRRRAYYNPGPSFFFFGGPRMRNTPPPPSGPMGMGGPGVGPGGYRGTTTGSGGYRGTTTGTPSRPATSRPSSGVGRSIVNELFRSAGSSGRSSGGGFRSSGGSRSFGSARGGGGFSRGGGAGRGRH